MTVKLKLFLPAGRHGFEFYEVRKSKHSRSYVNLFIMSKNEKEQNLGRYITLNLTLGIQKLLCLDLQGFGNLAGLLP